MFLYLILFTAAAVFTPGDAERCSGYRDYYGVYHSSFNCPDRSEGDDWEDRYCCGNKRYKYCCDDCDEKVYNPCRYYFSVGGKVGVGIGVTVFVLIVVALGCCCRAKQLRQRNQQTCSTITTSYPAQDQTHYPPGAMSYPPPSASGYPAAPAYPQPPPGGFVAAPPPYPGAGDAAYPPAYPGGPAYPTK